MDDLSNVTCRRRGGGRWWAAAMVGLATAAGASAAPASAARAPSGAIFTTLEDGSRVNANHYPVKDAVYLDGGPGPNAPARAASLDDGIYVFQVTDPTGRTLHSTDPAACRRFTVSGGIIVGVVAADGCEHSTGSDVDHRGVTVQVFSHLDYPEPGGVFKVWVTPVARYLAGCKALGVTDGLSVSDCGYKAGVAAHGFSPAASKTDTFKTAAEPPVVVL